MTFDVPLGLLNFEVTFAVAGEGGRMSFGDYAEAAALS
jgi:hypothetical protein